MSEIFFVFRVFVFTVALILFMQIKLGDRTIEDRASVWIQSSWITENVQGMGANIEKLALNSLSYIGSKWSQLSGSKKVGSRLEKFSFGRSDAYKKSQQKPSEEEANIIEEDISF